MTNHITMQAHLEIAECACAITEALADSPQIPPFMAEIQKRGGVCELRSFIVAELAPYIEQSYYYADALGYDDPFDAQYIPSALNEMIDWRHFHQMSPRDLGVTLAEGWRTADEYMRDIPF